MYMHKDIISWTNKSLLLVDNYLKKSLIDELNYIYIKKVFPPYSLDIYSINFQYPNINYSVITILFLYIMNEI